MVERRIKPYSQEVAERAARAVELRRYRRNQVFGLVLVAMAILIVALLRTNPKWIFAPGWWLGGLLPPAHSNTLFSIVACR